MKKNYNTLHCYREDAMMESFCLICGEHVGDYMYRGKPVCVDCIGWIRSNH